MHNLMGVAASELSHTSPPSLASAAQFISNSRDFGDWLLAALVYILILLHNHLVGAKVCVDTER